MRLSDLRELGWEPDCAEVCIGCGQEVHRLLAVEGMDGSWACPPCALWFRSDR